jgi:hypothetical protein
MTPTQSFRLDAGSVVRVGRRPDACIPVQERSVSRRHCLLEIGNDRVLVRDTASRNGTWVHNARIEHPTEIFPGTGVRLASTYLVLADQPPITEQEYREITTPERLFQFLPAVGGNRKLRLAGIACGRVMSGDTDGDEFARSFFESWEDYADGRPEATAEAIEKRVIDRMSGSNGGPGYLSLFSRFRTTYARFAAESVLGGLVPPRIPDSTKPLLVEAITDILGDFHSPARIAPEWLRWQNGTVLRIAKALYESRDYDELPVLADALEEAGCDDPRLLAHFRSGGNHVRGCWALDALLIQPGKQVAREPELTIPMP